MANWTEATEAKWPVLTPLSLAAESGVAHIRARVGTEGAISAYWAVVCGGAGWLAGCHLGLGLVGLVEEPCLALGVMSLGSPGLWLTPPPPHTE